MSGQQLIPNVPEEDENVSAIVGTNDTHNLWEIKSKDGQGQSLWSILPHGEKPTQAGYSNKGYIETVMGMWFD